jgi:hypothetical protein
MLKALLSNYCDDSKKNVLLGVLCEMMLTLDYKHKVTASRSKT